MAFDRFSSDHLDDTKLMVPDVKLFDNKEFLVTETEIKNVKSNFVILVVRILVQFFSVFNFCMGHLKSVIKES